MPSFFFLKKKKKADDRTVGKVSLFLISILALQFMLFMVHFMIYETLASIFGFDSLFLAVVLGLLSLTFMSSSFLAAKMDNLFVRIYYEFAAVWFSFVAPFCAACAAFVIIENLSPSAVWRITPFTVGMFCFGAAIVVSLYGIWNSYRIRATHVAMSLQNVPDAWRGKRFVFFSDVHLGNIRRQGFARRIVKKVQTLDPALVAICGDLFDGPKCDAEKLLAPFKELRPSRGFYYVSGNHEYIRDQDVFFDAIQNAGIRILRNEKVDVDGIDLVGVDWKDTAKKEDFATVLDGLHISPSRPSILLKHVPKDLDVAERAGISLQLSGHTHRGQFWPLSIATHYIYGGFDYGFHEVGKMFIYISSGVGTAMLPFRLGTKAEVVAIEFK
jgi:hypothetical protein